MSERWIFKMKRLEGNEGKKKGERGVSRVKVWLTDSKMGAKRVGG